MGDGLSDDCSLACLAVWISALVVFVVVVVVVVLDGPAFLRTVPTYASTMHREPLTVGTSKQAVEAGFAASVDQYLVNQSVNQSITQSLSHSSVSQADRLQASGFNLPAPGRRACHPSSLSLSLSPLLLSRLVPPLARGRSWRQEAPPLWQDAESGRCATTRAAFHAFFADPGPPNSPAHVSLPLYALHCTVSQYSIYLCS